MLVRKSKTRAERRVQSELTEADAAPRESAPPRQSGIALSSSVRVQVAHAERFAHTLDRLERGLPPRGAFTWMIGRADEVRVFAREVVSDWLRAQMDDAQANAVLEHYLAALHDELRACLGGNFAPSCCRASSGAMQRDDLAMARTAVRAAITRC